MLSFLGYLVVVDESYCVCGVFDAPVDTVGKLTKFVSQWRQPCFAEFGLFQQLVVIHHFARFLIHDPQSMFDIFLHLAEETFSVTALACLVLLQLA